MKSLHRAAARPLFFLVALAARAETAPPQGVLGLSASASVEVTKDLLAVTLSTTKEGADANVVQAQLKEALDAALVEAKKVARPGQLDVQTGNFSIYPRYTNATSSAKPTIRGWQGTVELDRRGPRHGGDRPAHRPHHDADDRPRLVPAVARGEPARRGRHRGPGDRRVSRQGGGSMRSSSAMPARGARSHGVDRATHRRRCR